MTALAGTMLLALKSKWPSIILFRTIDSSFSSISSIKGYDSVQGFRSCFGRKEYYSTIKGVPTLHLMLTESTRAKKNDEYFLNPQRRLSSVLILIVNITTSVGELDESQILV